MSDVATCNKRTRRQRNTSHTHAQMAAIPTRRGPTLLECALLIIALRVDPIQIRLDLVLGEKQVASVPITAARPILPAEDPVGIKTLFLLTM